MPKFSRGKGNFKQKYTPGEYVTKDRKDSGVPEQPRMDGNSTFLSKIAFKDLGYARPITVQANPTAEATKSAVPYAIINSTNAVWEADYPGANNTAGNTIPLLANSNKSKLLNNFDIAKVDLVVKYLYSAIRETDINQALNVQLGKSMSEALSKAYSETYIQMPLFNDLITSSMKNCDPLNRTQALIWYQTMLQNISSVPAKYNLLLSMEQHLKDMSYNRDVSPLDDIFGLLRKNAFRAQITAFSNIITGEYFDLTWFQQVNTLTMVPSRKSDDMRNPLLIIDASHDIPSLKITTDEPNEADRIVVLDSNNYKVKKPVWMQNPADPNDPKTISFQEAIATVIKLLSPYNVLSWAREVTNGLTDTNPTAYFNNIKFLMEDIRSVMNKFPSDVADIRTVLDIANRAGLNRWKRGVAFEVTRDMNYQPVFNKLCNDVFINYLASPNSIMYDDTTMRWKFYTLWDEFLGIPKYDRVSGGSFLSFSTRQFESSVTPSTDTKFLVPKLFDIPSTGYSSISALNRQGIKANIGFTIYSKTQINNSAIYNRLNPLSSPDYDQRIPFADLSSGYAQIPDVGSALTMFMNKLFGLGNIKISSTKTNEHLNAEIICATDIQLDDVSNQLIAFAQAYAPFKVYNPVKERTVGFRQVPSLI